MTTDLSVPLRAITDLLDRAAIPYMVVGSFAAMAHGVPRTTHDLDIVIDPSATSLDHFLRELDPESFYVDADVARDAFRRRSMFNVIDMNTAWKVDLIVRKDRPFSIEELRRRTVARLADTDVATATAEDTIIAKLEWARASNSERQLADVAGILRVHAATLDLEYIERWVDHLGLLVPWAAARSLTSS
ncbi:MAG: hypothetical protein KF773_20805 [Deltaproteobacteria bacterium]|nr:hypothetical protein [Deltaproteobacteria bacterium]